MGAGAYGNSTFDRNLTKGAKGLQAGRRYHKDGCIVTQDLNGGDRFRIRQITRRVAVC
jgi:hypothetical protein